MKLSKTRLWAMQGLLSMPIAVFALTGVTGTVKDKQGAPVEFATIRVEDAGTHKFVTGVTADIDGNFKIEDIPSGSYIVNISSVGSETKSILVTVTDKNVDLGVVGLGENSQLLKEVVVEGVRGQMSFELDRRVFNVDANIASAGLSASELLESVPSIEVDQDGEVSLRGDSSVTVWINGKESGLTSDNRAQILEQIPAESIEKIEVITNPSAKYSPEGTAGIINIILKKDRSAGYFGSAEVSGSNMGHANVNGNVNFNVGRWESYAGLGLRMRHDSRGSMTRRDYDDGYYLYSDGDKKNHGDNVFMRLGTTYHATDQDQISLSGFAMFGHRWGHSGTYYTSDLPTQWAANYNYSHNRGDMHGGHVELGYKHEWSSTHDIDINVSYNNFGGPGTNAYLQEQTYSDGAGEAVYQEQLTDIGGQSVEVKIDYQQQFLDCFKFETGFNGKFDREDSPTTTYSGTSQADKALDASLYNRFIYNNDIYAVYATIGGKLGKFNFSGGLRAEDWYVRTRSMEYGQARAEAPEYTKNNFALFPSAFLSYSLPYENEVQVNYTRRIRRPFGGQLNSFQDISNPTDISSGNPELEPQYTNAFELNYIKSWTFHMVSLSAYLRKTENNMNRISYLDGDVMYTTWSNVGDRTNSGAEFIVKNQFLRRLDLTTTLNLYNSHISAWDLTFWKDGVAYPVSSVGSDNFAWDIRCMAQLRLPWSMSFQVTGRYNSRRYNAQGTFEPSWNVDAGLRKSAGNWSFSLNCRDVFNSRKWHNFTYGDNYAQESSSWSNGTQVRLTVKYSFGNMKSDKKGREDADDDDSSGSYSDYGGDGI